MTPARIAVVTDSAACLPVPMAERLGVTVVPLTVLVGGRAHADLVDITSGEVAAALRRRVPVSTSRPSPKALAQAYGQAVDRGAEGIVSVHLSGELSGTWEAARLAADDLPVEVRVVDSRSLGMGLGFGALAAAEVAAKDGDLAEVARVAAERSAAGTVLFSLDTLEHLRRGGRIGAAQALLGSALAVKPLLHLVDGRVEPFEKVRTAARAVARLEELALAAAGSATVDVAVHHLDAGERASALAARLSARLPGVGECFVSEVSGAVGAHVGPGLLGVVLSPR
ncbi:MAG: DegV family protein [Actinomycetes bacterium]